MGNGVPSTEQEARKFALRAHNPGDHGLCNQCFVRDLGEGTSVVTSQQIYVLFH